MRCSVFKNRLKDFIEEDISYDLKEAMEEHMKNCEECRALYSEEKNYNDVFAEAFSAKEITFKSARIDIMNGIDQKKYGKSPIKKVIYHLKRNRVTYSSCVALFVFMMVSTSYYHEYKENKYLNAKATETVKKQDIKTNFSATTMDKASMNSTEQKKDSSIKPAEVKNEQNIYIPKFQKVVLDKNKEPEFGTAWKDSPSKILSECIEGLGVNGAEEGIGKIYIKNLKNGDKIAYELAENTKKNTPRFLSWWDDENLLIIIGYGYGSISPGGGLYILNSNTGKCDVVLQYCDENKNVDTKQQITSVKRTNTALGLKVTVYEDDNWIKSHIEDRTLENSEKIINPILDKIRK